MAVVVDYKLLQELQVRSKEWGLEVDEFSKMELHKKSGGLGGMWSAFEKVQLDAQISLVGLHAVPSHYDSWARPSHTSHVSHEIFPKHMVVMHQLTHTTHSRVHSHADAARTSSAHTQLVHARSTRTQYTCGSNLFPQEAETAQVNNVSPPSSAPQCSCSPGPPSWILFAIAD